MRYSLPSPKALSTAYLLPREEPAAAGSRQTTLLTVSEDGFGKRTALSVWSIRLSEPVRERAS